MATSETGKGKLYLCPTPIGNLSDMSQRGLDVLESVDLIAAEDTRNTINLLNHYGISSHMTSYHEHNKYDKADEIIRKLSEGMNVACVTDAGTPGISDPGEILVKKAIEAGIDVVSLPGATAFVTALTVSGLSTRRFVFEGFLPRDKKERQRVLNAIKNETRTIILYEAPHHLKDTLEILDRTLGGDRRIAACRELTKIHEEILRMSIREMSAYYREREPRGEYVLVIEGRPIEELESMKREAYEGISVSRHVQRYMDCGMDKKEAMKKAAVDRGVSKRDIYQMLLLEEDQKNP